MRTRNCGYLALTRVVEHPARVPRLDANGCRAARRPVECEHLGLVGRNGAGTTTLATVMGLAKPKKARIHFGEDDISGASTFARSRAGPCHVPQSRDIFPSLTAEGKLLSGLQGRSASVALPPIYPLFPRTRGAVATELRSWRVASSKCCLWLDHSSPSPASCRWTSRRRAWRRWCGKG